MTDQTNLPAAAAAGPSIQQLRQHLMDTLTDLRDRTNPMDVERAKAVATVATVLVDSVKAENEYLKITGQEKSRFLETDTVDDVPALGSTPGNGITTITRHRMRG